MDFEVFTEKMMELLKERLGEEYEIGVHEELKNNGIRKTGIGVKKEGAHFGPVLFLEEAYGKYREGMDAEKVLDELLDVYKSACDQDTCEKFQLEAFGDYSQVKERLRFRLVNYGMNREMLADVPYIRWNDLAVIFCYEVDTWEGGDASIIIRNSHLAIWGKTVGILYEDALNSMKSGVQDDLFSIDDLFPTITVPGMDDLPPMYILTNKMKKHGAAVMLYSGKMKELADTVDSDLVILPSSLHEVLLLPDDAGMHGRWRQMVREVNRSAVVDPEDVLSDNIYRYSREKDAVELMAAG